jgi:hypothetical protein
LVVAGLGGSRSEKRAVGLSGKGGWPWLSAGGGGGKKRKKKKKPTPCRSQLGFRWWWKEKKKKKEIPTPSCRSHGFRWWLYKLLRKENKVLLKVVINC